METKVENRRYFGCRLMQRSDLQTTPLFIFQATAKDVRKWSGIRSVDEHKEGTQRLLKETRRKAITRFLSSDAKNIIPNSILIAFEPGKAKFTSLDEKIISLTSEIGNPHNGCNGQLNWGFLEFSFETNQPESSRPALIVDGQHRLYGISDFQQENLPVLIVALVDASLEEKAFQFIVINNKAVKVPTDNVKSIIANLDEDKLQSRLLKAGVRYGETSPILRDINDLEVSPFQFLLDWAYNKTGTRLVPLTAIEQSLRNLRTYFPFLEDDEDSQFGIFCAIWRAVKANYPSLWGRQNNFMTKVNINALNEFLTDRLKKAWEFGLLSSIFDIKEIEEKVLSILQPIPEDFWQQRWNITIQDNANIRKIIKEDLETQIQNYKLSRLWSEGLQLPAMDE